MTDGGIKVLSVGNDLVDIKRTERHHPRFAQRVSSVRELDVIAKMGPSDPQLIWKMWAAKEASYKALKRIRPEIIFSPRNFEIDFDTDTAFVREVGETLYLKVFTHKDWVYCSASTLKAARVVNYVASRSDIAKNETAFTDFSPSLAEHSKQVRMLARLAAGKAFSVAPNSIQVVDPAEGKAPSLAVGKEKTIPISLTHHGEYLGVAWIVPAVDFSSTIYSL
jgi:phosphopantetheinyl transferase